MRPKNADDRRARARTSCVMTEQSALRPDTQVAVTVALAAGAGMTDSAERAQYEVEHPGLLDAQVRASGPHWSLAAGTEWASSPDPQSRRADEDIPVGWARGRMGNALVAVDVALEFGTERQARQAAETLVREVLDRIRRTHGLPAGPVPEGPPLTRVPDSHISDASRFGVFDRNRTGRLMRRRMEGGRSRPRRDTRRTGGVASAARSAVLHRGRRQRAGRGPGCRQHRPMALLHGEPRPRGRPSARTS